MWRRDSQKVTPWYRACCHFVPFSPHLKKTLKRGGHKRHYSSLCSLNRPTWHYLGAQPVKQGTMLAENATCTPWQLLHSAAVRELQTKDMVVVQPWDQTEQQSPDHILAPGQITNTGKPSIAKLAVPIGTGSRWMCGFSHSPEQWGSLSGCGQGPSYIAGWSPRQEEANPACSSVGA